MTSFSVDHNSCAATLPTLRIPCRPPVRATGGVIPAGDLQHPHLRLGERHIYNTIPPVLPYLLHPLLRQHLGLRVHERGAEVIRALEATGDLCLGVLQHVRCDLGASLGSLDRAFDARLQRRVVGVIVGPDAVKKEDEARHVIVAKMVDKAESVSVV